MHHAGTVAILIAFVIPCALRLQSIIECAKVSTSIRKSNGGSAAHSSTPEVPLSPLTRYVFPSSALASVSEDQVAHIRTPYASPWSNDVSMITVFVIGVGVFFYVLISLIKSGG
jgi:hypothetical protein